MSGYRTPGYYGIAIYGLLFLYTFFRLFQSLAPPQQHNQVKYLNYKLGFHFIFGCFCLFELIYSYSLTIDDRITSWGYSFHFVALFLNVVSFAMIINLWGYSLNFYRAYWKFSVLSSILILINFVGLIISLIYILTYSGYKGYSEKTTPYVTVLLLHVFSLLLFSIVLLAYGFHISHKLAQSYDQKVTFTQVLKDKLYLLFRINIILSICFFCYLLRAVLIAILVYEELNDITIVDFPGVLWFLLSAWIPTVGPGVIFLYIMKTTSFTRGSRNFSSDAKDNQAQLTPISHDRQEDDPMVMRYSWYYEEKESSKPDDRVTMDDRSGERPSSVTMIARMVSVKDSLLYRESNAM